MDNPKTAGSLVGRWLFFICLASGSSLQAQPVITEVMFRPLDADSEYAEFFNPGADSLDPAAIRFRDGYSTTSLIHVAGPPKIPPRSHALLIDKDYFLAGNPRHYEQVIPPGTPVFKTSNASIGNGLDNTSDFLCILSASTGDTLSSISWQVTVPAGFSIERRHPAGPPGQFFPGANWIQSVLTHGTPGQPYAGDIPVLTDASLVSVHQSGDTAGHVILTNIGILPATPVTISLSDPSGELLFISNPFTVPAGGESHQPFSIRRLPQGLYPIVARISGDTGDKNNDSLLINWKVEATAARDIRMDSVSFDGWVQVGRPVNVKVTLKSAGWLPTGAGTVRFKPGNEFLAPLGVENIGPGQSQTITFRWIPAQSGPIQYSAEWEGSDDVPENNRSEGWVTVEKAWPLNDLRLTEVMANPDGSDYGNEFIELTNLHPTDSLPVSIITFRNGSATFQIEPVSQPGKRLGPGQTLVVFCESWFSLPDRLYTDLEGKTGCVIAKSEPAFSLTNRNGSLEVFADSVASDSFTWGRDAGDGRSWERVAVPQAHVNRFWQPSPDLNGNPGKWAPPPLQKISSRWIRRLSATVGVNGFSVTGKIQFTGSDTLRHTTLEGKLVYRNLSGSRPVEVYISDLNQLICFGDSVETGFSDINASPGSYQFIMSIQTTGVTVARDTVDVTLPFTPGTLKMTEISSGATGVPSFVELVNDSEYPVYPDEIKIGWKTGPRSSVSPSNSPIWPGGRCILLKKDEPVPSGATGKVIWCASFPDLLSGSGTLTLTSPQGSVIDSVFLPPGWLQPGYSYERVDSLGLVDWRTSRWPGGSPAQPNTWPVRFLDVALAGMEKADAFPDEPLNLSLTIRNTGLAPAERLQVRGWFLSDAGTVDSLGIWNALEYLNPGDSVVVPFSLRADQSGRCRFVADFPPDERPSSNVIEIPVHFHEGIGVVVNEFLSDPGKGSDGRVGPDWIELLNTGSRPVALKAWAVRDGAGNQVWLDEELNLLPGEYLVVADDSTFFSRWKTDTLTSRVVILSDRLDLNAGEDSILIKDEWGYRIESVGYRPDWHHPDLESTTGISLERRRSDLPAEMAGNWNSSGDQSGGTPGRKNSVAADMQKPGSGRLTATPNPFFPDEGEACEISWRLPAGIYTADLRVFDIIGRELDPVMPVGPVAENGVVFWMGRHQGRRVPAGPYIILQSFRNQLTGEQTTRKLVVVVGCRL